MRIWPFKRKKKVQRCPEAHRIAKVCVCMDCPKIPMCPIEEACKKSGCENTIRACSLKASLTQKGGVSEFANNVAQLTVYRMLKELSNEEEYQRARKGALDRRMKTKEGLDAKKETGSEGTLNREGPTVGM